MRQRLPFVTVRARTLANMDTLSLVNAEYEGWKAAVAQDHGYCAARVSRGSQSIEGIIHMSDSVVPGSKVLSVAVCRDLPDGRRCG